MKLYLSHGTGSLQLNITGQQLLCDGAYQDFAGAVGNVDNRKAKRGLCHLVGEAHGTMSLHCPIDGRELKKTARGIQASERVDICTPTALAMWRAAKTSHGIASERRLNLNLDIGFRDF